MNNGWYKNSFFQPVQNGQEPNQNGQHKRIKGGFSEMNHSFNVEIAKQYGIEKAILLENFFFWVAKNKANNKNIHEGRACS